MALASDDDNAMLLQLVDALGSSSPPTYSEKCLATFSSTHYRISAPVFAQKIRSLVDQKLVSCIAQRVLEMFQALLHHDPDSQLIQSAPRFALAVLRNVLASTGNAQSDWVRAQTCFNFCSCIHIYTHGTNSSPLDAVWKTIADASVARRGPTKNHTVRYPSWHALLLRVAVERSVVSGDWTAAERVLEENSDLLRETRVQVSMMEDDGLVFRGVVDAARGFLYKDCKRAAAVGLYKQGGFDKKIEKKTRKTKKQKTKKESGTVFNERCDEDDYDSAINLSTEDIGYLIGENDVDSFLGMLDEVLSIEHFDDKSFEIEKKHAPPQQQKQQATLDAFFKARRSSNAPWVHEEDVCATPKKRKARTWSQPTPETAQKILPVPVSPRVKDVGQKSINITDIGALRLIVRPTEVPSHIRMRRVQAIQPEVVIGSTNATETDALRIPEGLLLCLESIDDLC